MKRRRIKPTLLAHLPPAGPPAAATDNCECTDKSVDEFWCLACNCECTDKSVDELWCPACIAKELAEVIEAQTPSRPAADLERLEESRKAAGSEKGEKRKRSDPLREIVGDDVTLAKEAQKNAKKHANEVRCKTFRLLPHRSIWTVLKESAAELGASDEPMEIMRLLKQVPTMALTHDERKTRGLALEAPETASEAASDAEEASDAEKV